VLGWKPKGIVAMTGCVLTAVLGMLSVVWYALGEHASEEEMESEERAKQEKKDARKAGGIFGGLRRRV
jgi:iron transport multicopper oxidase